MTFSTANGELILLDVPRKISSHGKRWLPGDIEKLKQLYATNTNVFIAEKLNRSAAAILAKAYKLSLKKDNNWLINQVKKTWFKKGHIPHNEGVKGIHYSPKSEFKKGHQPQNTKFDGAISIRYDGYNEQQKPYYHIRLANGEWEYLHRHIWKNVMGKIPKNHIIRFIDGNTLNCDINNLMCITRAQNAQLNQNRRKAAQTLKRTLNLKK